MGSAAAAQSQRCHILWFSNLGRGASVAGAGEDYMSKHWIKDPEDFGHNVPTGLPDVDNPYDVYVGTDDKLHFRHEGVPVKPMKTAMKINWWRVLGFVILPAIGLIVLLIAFVAFVEAIK